jgi:small subunit ribosomal protein S1
VAPIRHLDPTDLEAIASMDPSEMAAFLDASSSRERSHVEVGAKVTGRVTRVGKDNVFVDLGAKAEGMLDRSDLPDGVVGDEVTAYVIDFDENGIQLTRRLAGDAAAGFIDEAKAAGIPVEGRVASRNPGGFEIRIGSVRAFCPSSQMDRLSDRDPDAYIGQTFSFKVLEAGDDVVVSRRALQEAGLSEVRAAFWGKVAVGDLHRGTVTSVQPFGVFVDLDGVEGLVPRRELGWGDSDAAPTRGQTLAVRVVEIDPTTRKLTLSAKDPALSPWNRVAADFPLGSTHEGTVMRVAAYGAFVEVAPGVQGLLHVSRTDRVGKLPQEGEKIKVVVTAVDRERERIELSGPTWVARGEAGPGPAGEIVEGKVEQVLHNGLVVDLADGRTGWIPLQEIDLPSGTILAQRFRVGRDVKGRVLQDDPSRRRATLSLRLEAPEEAGWREETARQKGGGGSSFGTLAGLLSGFKAKKS